MSALAYRHEDSKTIKSRGFALMRAAKQMPDRRPDPANALVLAINGGSSTIRFALFVGLVSPAALLRGRIDRIAQGNMTFECRNALREVEAEQQLGPGNLDTAIEFLMTWMQAQPWLATLSGIGHRVVHGLKRTAPQLVDAAFLLELERLIPFDPQHMTGEIALISAFREQCPEVAQIACFDTVFHRDMPQVARLLPIPRRYQAEGLQRYGFHGLSYGFCMKQLRQVGDSAAERGRVILAHLGNGASLAAVLDGRSIDTSMGFTSTGGVPMSTRSGDLDPGVAYYLSEIHGVSAQQFHHMVNNESGLRGISETSGDLRDLLAVETVDARAAEAVALFCYQIRKCIGALAAALGGIDTLVITGGVGENSSVIRARICAGLEFLGIALDGARNTSHAAVLSKDGVGTRVRLVHTDEELMIAMAVAEQLGAA